MRIDDDARFWNMIRQFCRVENGNLVQERESCKNTDPPELVSRRNILVDFKPHNIYVFKIEIQREVELKKQT